MARGAAARHPPTTQALAGHSLRDTAAQVHGMRAYRVCVRAAASCMFKSKLFMIKQLHRCLVSPNSISTARATGEPVDDGTTHVPWCVHI